jgi:hypothetical protein
VLVTHGEPVLQNESGETPSEAASSEYHWTLVGTNTGPGGTGNRVRITGLEAWTFGDDGQIAESQGRYDQAEYNRQLEHGVDESR